MCIMIVNLDYQVEITQLRIDKVESISYDVIAELRNYGNEKEED